MPRKPKGADPAGEVMSSVERNRIDSEKNFLDVLDKAHEISGETVDDTHARSRGETPALTGIQGR